MKKPLMFLALLTALSVMSCEPNEISFFIQHVKALPEAPACSYSVSDDFVSGIVVDLALQPGVTNAYLLKNQLISREDYDNLRAESNGILAEGYEISVSLSATNETIGGSNRYSQELYIPPQSEELMFAYTIPPDVSRALADELNCLLLNSTNYPDDTVFQYGTDVNGNAVARDLGNVLSTVRFFGHTQGAIDVETQGFSFPIRLCCGCSVNWNNCASTCERYCKPVKTVQTCNPGVVDGDNQYDCRALYAGTASWTGCVDEDGVSRPCTCDLDCPK